MQTFSKQSKIVIRSNYSDKVRYDLSCPETPYGRTKQSFKAECDINTIIKRFLKTGTLEFVAKNEPRYGDCTGIEYQNAMQTVAAAQSLFNELPSALRNRFENEPAKFLAFVQDKKNQDEAIALGLCTPQRRPGSQALPPSHREDGSATHEPLRAPDGTYREHTRKEKRDEARALKQSPPADEGGN